MTISDLCDLVVDDYKTQGHDTLDKAQRNSKRIEGFFEGFRAHDTRSVKHRIKQYMRKRQDDGAMNATINRELSFIGRGYSIGVDDEIISKIIRVEKFKLPEDNVRSNFFELSQYTAMRDELPNWLCDPLIFGFHIPWRKENIFELQWTRVDPVKWRIRVDAVDTKTKKAIYIVIPKGECRNMMQKRFRGNIKRDASGAPVKKKDGTFEMICPFVFHRDGKQIKPDIRTA